MEKDGQPFARIAPPTIHERCEWPWCDKSALCSTGNFGGMLVCREHFMVTNGETSDWRITEESTDDD